jgi:hypothetical protein
LWGAIAREPQLTDALLAAGYGQRVIGKILRGNALRVLEKTKTLAVSTTTAASKPSPKCRSLRTDSSKTSGDGQKLT